eukprot:scaffold17644_cov54-Phaeocystis_antarctica.AAC.2
MELSVRGCRLPKISRFTSSTTCNSGSAAARSPLASNSRPRLPMEMIVFGCRLPYVSLATSSSS